MLHSIKIERRYYDRIIANEKTFEVRKNDRDYQVGDDIKFCMIDNGAPMEYEGHNGKIWNIIYVHHGLGMQEGYVVLGIQPDKELNKNPLTQ